jgi:hypothetical protein
MEPRQVGTHINDEGHPKMPYDTEAAAREHADRVYRKNGQMLQPYRCWMNPEHYHLSKSWTVNNVPVRQRTDPAP